MQKANIPEFSVSEISTALKRTIETTYENVRIRGEISNLRAPPSGHIYFDLKDDRAILKGVIWRNTATLLRFEPNDGLEVVAEGRVTTYASRSQYQLTINRLEIAGVGALLALLEERRKKLAGEGLFDLDRKQKPPYLPEVIGVITSPTGAVIRDILHRLRDRFPRRVIVWPVLVQGNGAAEQVAHAIQGFNDLNSQGNIPSPDVILIARGGGSVEDLMAFNEEVVVRAASRSSIPIISAIGHETDTTLLDFAADLRAPTPTAAAEIAVPVRSELLVTVSGLERQLFAALQRTLTENRRTVDILGRSLPSAEAIIGDAAQRLDDRIETITRVFSFYFEQLSLRIEKSQIHIRDPKLKLSSSQERFDFICKELTAAGTKIYQACLTQYLRWTDDNRLSTITHRILGEKNHALDSNKILLQSYNYRNVLKRGYAVVRNNSDRLVTRSKQAQKYKAAKIEFFDATADIIIKKNPNTKNNNERTPAKSTESQRKLL